jgi:hypothetical protein
MVWYPISCGNKRLERVGVSSSTYMSERDLRTKWSELAEYVYLATLSMVFGYEQALASNMKTQELRSWAPT